jgi:hypothetical protein
MKFIKLLVFVVILLLTMLPVYSVQASTFWEDDFSGTLDDWELQGYTFDGNFQTIPANALIDSGISIENEVLVGPLTTSHPDGSKGNWSVAMHESDVVYGNWTFDIFMEKSSLDQGLSTEIAFMFSDPVLKYDWINESNSRAIEFSEAYILFINNIFLLGPAGNTIILDLDKHPGSGSSRTELGEARFDIEFDRFHQISITRTTDFKIKIYFDGDLKIEVQETTETALTSSEKFMFFQWVGKYKLDNVVVEDLTSPSAIDGFVVTVSGFLLLILTIKRQINKKRE